MKLFILIIGILLGLIGGSSLGYNALEAQQKLIIVVAKNAYINACLDWQTRVMCEAFAEDYIAELKIIYADNTRN